MSKPPKKTDSDKPWNRPVRKRLVGVRSARVRILLVCEDTKSAVYYFKRIQELLPPNVVFLYSLGTGMNTQSLINEVDNIRCREEKRLRISFDQIWAFFDKDSFGDAQFDNAIRSGVAKGYRVAWSNECFELWYLLHFQKQFSAMSRKAIYDRLSVHLGVRHYEDLKGEDGIRIHRRMAEDSEARKEAIKRAAKLDEKGQIPFHRQNPLTKVYLLFNELESWIV